MASVKKVRAKLGKRKRGMKKQLRKWKKTGRRGHLKLFRKYKAMVKHLRALVKKSKPQPVDWNGLSPLRYAPIIKAARTALTVPGLYITSTTGGTHSPTSWHYKAKAFDAGSGASDEGPEKRAQQKLLNTYGAGYFAELFGPLPWYVKSGVVYSGVFPGHSDHLHVAVA